MQVSFQAYLTVLYVTYFDCFSSNLSRDKINFIRMHVECNSTDAGKIDKRYEFGLRSANLPDIGVSWSAWMWEASEYNVYLAVPSGVTDITRTVDTDTKCLQQESGLCPCQDTTIKWRVCKENEYKWWHVVCDGL